MADRTGPQSTQGKVPTLAAITTSTPTWVFISYASADKTIADAVCDALERNGVVCWIAPRNVTPGVLYAEAIIRAIAGANALIVILSTHSIASSHVGKEVERASSKQRPIITLRIDSAPLTPALEYFLSESQWVESPTGNKSAAYLQLLDAIRQIQESACCLPSEAGRGVPATLATFRVPAPRRTRVFVLAALIVLVVIGAVLLTSKFVQPKQLSSGQAARQAISTPKPNSPTFAPPLHSIAVLPFVNMSGDSKEDYFSDGISEELLNSLSHLNGLQVAARTSSFSFKGQNVDLATIAHKLNVGSVLEGSVRRGGKTVRITVQLINTATGFHTWSQTYDRSLTDLLAIQTEVATLVAQHLQIQLDADAAIEMTVGATSNPDAHDAYLRGRQLLVLQTTDESNSLASLEAFNRAIALDSGYASAYVGRSSALGSLAIFNAKLNQRETLRKQSREAAERAVALAPALAEAHMALGAAFAYGFLNFGSAVPEFDRALALAPGSAVVQRGFSSFASLLGRSEIAISAARRAASLDPENIAAYTNLGTIQFQARRYDEALAALRQAMVLDPTSKYIEYFVVSALLASGHIDQAGFLCASPSAPLVQGARHRCLSLVYHATGREADAQRELKQYQEEYGDEEAFSYASIYAQWGEKAAALQWLKKADELRDPEFQVIRVAWELDPIRGDPNFKAIEAKMNFPP